MSGDKGHAEIIPGGPKETPCCGWEGGGAWQEQAEFWVSCLTFADAVKL